MWGLVYNGLCSFAFTIKCLSSYVKTLVLRIDNTAQLPICATPVYP